MIRLAWLALAVGTFVSACSTAPELPAEHRYARQDWAKVSAQQAEAECYAEINRPGGIPNMYLCMRAKGWQER